MLAHARGRLPCPKKTPRKCEQILDERKTDRTDRPTSRLGDLGDIIGNRRSRSRPKIENPQIAMSCTYTELRGHTRERYLTSQMLRPSQAHGSPFVGQSGEAREPSGTRRTASPTERNSSSGHWATTHPGGRSGENANTPNRLKHRALLKLEPRTRMGKGRARTSLRSNRSTRGSGLR